ncbi:MAG: SDR family oxidoreductase [Verrucomicrobiae bacterium]|nr:SDR family oxidoreductase [Verrucomicrobiae bacterium]
MLTIDLQDKTALVIGGSRGIGAEITRTLCRAGASTLFTHTGNSKHQNQVSSLLKEIHDAGGTAEAEVLQACDSAATTRLIQKLTSKWSRIDLLVCNVGQNLAQPAENVTDEGWRKFIDINLSSAFYAVRAVLPLMMASKHGRIILIGSSVVYDGGGGAIDYAAGKAGLAGMMAYLTRNYARKGILTNIIHPCVIETDLLKERYGTPEKKQKLIEQVPAGRLGQPRDIAGLVAYLASSWGDFICGQAILVDGGRTIF